MSEIPAFINGTDPECDAVLSIKGEHFPCDLTTPHVGLAHSSTGAESIWFGAREAKEAAAAWVAADPRGER